MATPAAPLPDVVIVAETGSTQSDLIAAVLAEGRAAWPHLSGIRALRQRSGRGRADRTWDTDRLAALTVSLVLRPELPASALPWIPMLTGLAVARSLRAAGVAATLKWPNDVVLPATDEIDGWGSWRKVAGVLAQALPDPSGVVVGIGVNIAGQPPVPWAGTLADAHADIDAETLLEAIRHELAQLLASDPGGWRDAVGDVCSTMGAQVLVSLPDGASVQGEAFGLDPAGGLLVRGDDGVEHLVMAGDVEHCRVNTSRDR